MSTTGFGGFVEAGYRIGMFEPIVSAELFRSDVEAGDFVGLHGGGAVFFDKHRANLKVDVARTVAGEAAAVWSGALQGQLSF